MLQIAYIRENQEQVVKALAKRNLDATEMIQKVIDLDEQRRATQVELDNILAESNKLSKEIGDLMRNGEKAKAEILKEKTAKLKDKTADLKERLNIFTDELTNQLYQIPNTPEDIVPEGKTPEDNLTVFEQGEIPVLAEGSLPHSELAKKYDIIDFELGAKITGAGYPVYKEKGAKLQRALISYFLDKNTEAGYNEVQVPHL